MAEVADALRAARRRRAPAAGGLRVPQPADGAARRDARAARSPTWRRRSTRSRFVSTVTGAAGRRHRARRRVLGRATCASRCGSPPPSRPLAALGCDVFVESARTRCSAVRSPRRWPPTGRDPGASSRRCAGAAPSGGDAPRRSASCTAAASRVDWAAVMPGRRRVGAAADVSMAAPASLVRRPDVATADRAGPPRRRRAPARSVGGCGRPPSGRVFETELRAHDPAVPRRPPHRRDRRWCRPRRSSSWPPRRFAAATARPAAPLDDVELLAALALRRRRRRRPSRSTSQGDDEAMTFTHHQPATATTWIDARHRPGARRRRRSRAGPPPTSTRSAAAARQRTGGDDLYADIAARGSHFGPCVPGRREVWVGDGEALGRHRARRRRSRPTLRRYGFHPALLDAALHAARAPAAGRRRDVPADRPRRAAAATAPPAERMWSHVQLRGRRRARTVTADVVALRRRRCAGRRAGRAAARAHEPRAPSPAWSAERLAAPAGELLYELAWTPCRSRPATAAPPAGPWLIVADAAASAPRSPAGSRRRARAASSVALDDELIAGAACAELLARRRRHARSCYLARPRHAAARRGARDVVADQERGLGGALAVAQALAARRRGCGW